MTDAEQARSRDRARSRSYGKQILAVVAVLLAIYGVVAYNTGGLDFIVVLPLLVVAGVGFIALIAPESRVAQGNLKQNAAFIDLPGDRILLWGVPFSLRHHYVGTARPYKKYALAAAGTAGVFVAAIALGRSADRVSWPVYVVLVVATQAIAFASAWAQTGLVVAVSMQHGLLRIRDYGLGVLGLSERSVAVTYDQLKSVEFTSLGGQDAERWLVQLRGKDGWVITLGLDGKDLASVREAFEASAVPTTDVAA